MDPLTEKVLCCPYCGEAIEVLIDPQEVGQQYIEDCQVCCRPITFLITVDPGGGLSVSLHAENDTI